MKGGPQWNQEEFLFLSSRAGDNDLVDEKGA